MKYLSILLFVLAGCANVNTPVYEPTNNDEYIEQLEASTSAETKSDALKLYTYVGSAMFVGGILLIAFRQQIKSGLTISGGGLVAMGTPFIFNSGWFDWIIGIAFGLCVAEFLYFLFKITANYISRKRSSQDNQQ